MRRRLQHTLVAALAAVAFWPCILSAQVEVAPALGTYIPLGGGWTQESDGGTGFAPNRRQRAAHMLATRVSVWTSRRLAFEGTVAYSPSQVAVSVDGVSVRLTRREFELLRYLVENRNRVLSRDRLPERVRGYDRLVETRSVDVHVGRLRGKLGVAGRQIETVVGLGYRFVE